MKDQRRLNEIQMRADWIARLMDDCIEIPFLKIRLGWDSILGFIPGVGDLVGLLSHGFLVTQAIRGRVRKRVYVKMAAYALVDFLVGAIPGVGDVFDIFWKSNRKSAELLRKELSRQTRSEVGRK